MRRMLFCLFAASTLSAQFAEFAVTDDGRLYFSTPLAFENEDSRTKVFRVTGDGLALAATGGAPTSPFGPTASAPLVSGDGSISGYALHHPCFGPCMFALPRTSFRLQGAELRDTSYDTLQVSRNGRFLLGRTFDARTRLIDLAANATREFGQFRVPAAKQALANSGAALLLTQPLSFVPFGEEPRPIPGTESATEAMLSPNGDLVAYERTTAASYALVLTDPGGSAHRLLASAPRDLEAPWPAFRFRSQPSFANDGALLYLEPDLATGRGQPMLLAPGGEPRPLSSIDGGAHNAIVSGDGQLVWLTTYSGQLLRVRSADGAADEMIAATPYVTSGSLFAYPGSVIRLLGSGLPADTQVRLGDTPLPLAGLNAHEIVYQLPWEYTPASPAPSLTIRGPASPFRQELRFAVVALPTVTFERGGPRRVLQAAHDDFHGVITAEDPARPGETIHVFARNMGPVDLPVATGQPSPSDPPARILAPIGCYLFPVMAPGENGPAVGLEVPFAGLAGGLIGIYQIDVTIPADWRAPLADLQCRLDIRGDVNHIPVGVSATSPSP